MIESRVAAIVADAEAAFDGERWPAHPLDDEVTESETRTLYLGAHAIPEAPR